MRISDESIPCDLYHEIPDELEYLHSAIDTRWSLRNATSQANKYAHPTSDCIVNPMMSISVLDIVWTRSLPEEALLGGHVCKSNCCDPRTVQVEIANCSVFLKRVAIFSAPLRKTSEN